MIFLDLDDAIHIARRVLGHEPDVRDAGLLQAALARPQATAFGEDAYPTLHRKAAAMMHSLARDHALVDGNKRLALAGAIGFLGLNGQRLTLSDDEAYDLTVAVATGQLDDIETLAAALRTESTTG